MVLAAALEPVTCSSSARPIVSPLVKGVGCDLNSAACLLLPQACLSCTLYLYILWKM
jgi:hypothetical protein